MSRSPSLTREMTPYALLLMDHLLPLIRRDHTPDHTPDLGELQVLGRLTAIGAVRLKLADRIIDTPTQPHPRLWATVMRALPKPPDRTAPASLLAVALWQRPAAAKAALRLALAGAPDDTFANHLMASLTNGRTLRPWPPQPRSDAPAIHVIT